MVYTPVVLQGTIQVVVWTGKGLCNRLQACGRVHSARMSVRCNEQWTDVGPGQAQEESICSHGASHGAPGHQLYAGYVTTVHSCLPSLTAL